MKSTIKDYEPKYCLCFDLDNGMPYAEPLACTPAEKVPVRNYQSSIIGSLAFIERMIYQINRKPFLAEKYIKLF